MTSSLSRVFSDLGNILAICPQDGCGRPFYVSEARIYMDGNRQRSFVDTLRVEERRLEEQEQLLDLLEKDLRQAAAKAGQKAAKKLLKKIDPWFSGSGYDPQDVKVVFDPVSYVIFDGLHSENLKQILLLSYPPENGSSETVQLSLAMAIKRGNIEFRTLRDQRRPSMPSLGFNHYPFLSALICG